MSTNTIKLHRVLRAKPNEFTAFIDPDAMAKWLPPNGFTGKVHQMDAKSRLAFTKCPLPTFSTGKSHSFGGKYLELTPTSVSATRINSMIQTCPAEMITTISLREIFCGTELNVTRRVIPAAIPRKPVISAGRKSLVLLAKLVEAEIPDQP
jgi:uncharacterized protein YndB with AHSA1/START domain